MGRILQHDVVDSTSERAFAALAAGSARDGDLHVAAGQTAGRGRQGRVWVSATGAGLFVSLVHLPPAPGPVPPAVTMAAGLAVRDAVAAAGLDGTRLDWPNDLVLDGAKLAGILVETRGLDPERPCFVVGIGVNVRQAAFPRALEEERLVTSLALAGVEIEPAELLERLVQPLESRLERARESPDEISSAYLTATGLAGGEVVVRTGDRTVRGRVAALDVEQGLVLQTTGDRRLRLELAHVRTLDPAPTPL